jgi:inward rectifier potassium channel
MYYPDKDNLSTVLDLDKINAYQKEEFRYSVEEEE